MGISLKGFGNSNGQGAQIAGLTALPPTASDIRLPSTTSDPHFSQVDLLAKFDDDYVDVIGNAIATTNGSISNSTYKFGTGAVYGSGVTAWTVPSDFFSMAGDFTWECWINVGASGGGGPVIMGYRVSGANNTIINYGWPVVNRLNFILNDSVQVGFELLVGERDLWHHLAVSRTGSSLKMFLDGVERDSATNSTNFSKSFTTFELGQSATAGGASNAYLDDLRITNGVGRYTEAFDIPTAAFPTS